MNLIGIKIKIKIISIETYYFIRIIKYYYILI